MEQKILNLLREDKGKGMSITELVSASNLSRSNVRTILARLEGAGKVSIRQVGMAKLYYLVEKEEEKGERKDEN